MSFLTFKTQRAEFKYFFVISAFILFPALIFSACSALPKVMVVQDPLPKEEHLDLGLIYERDGKLDLAERELLAALPLQMAVLGLGNVYFQKGDYKQAERYYRRAISKSNDPIALNNLAFLYVIEGRNLKEASKLAERAVEEGIKRNLSDEEINNFKLTYNQAETALNRYKRE